MLWNNNYNIVESIDQKLNRGGVPPLVVDYLIVGGGGAGQAAITGIGYGGGGSGGFNTGSLSLAFNIPFQIIVGAGGIVSVSNGQSSSFSGDNFGTPISLTAGGGITPTYVASIQTDGRSGALQYNAGGSGNACAGGGRYYGGGGGGAMAIGESAICLPTARGGNGGAAIAWYSGSFAGGGGGGVIGLAGETPQAGAGGSSTNGRSGGDGGSFTSAGIPPVQNTGGGGGGAGNNNLYPASNGASGSVIIRYPYIQAEFAIPYATGGDKYIYDGYVYHRFNSNGTFATFAR
jgi:hypothetical protein